MPYIVRIVLLFVLLSLALQPLMAQETRANIQEQKYLSEPIRPQAFDEQKWQESVKGLDYRIKKKKTQAPPPKESPAFEWPTLGKAWLIFFKGMAILILVVMLALLVRHYLSEPKNIAVKKAIREDLSIEEIEENLDEVELTPYIRKAIDQENFGLAIRLYYLEILQQLSAQKMIFWRKNKTNRQYVQEMLHSNRYGEFRLLTLIFERVRYGGQGLSRSEFEQIEPGFHSFLKGTASSSVPRSTPLNAAV